MKKLLLFLLFSLPAFAQLPCEFSNTVSDAGTASINAATGQGFSAPAGVGAVGFRLQIACKTNYVAYHVWTVDTSTAAAPNTYDIGLYCQSGDCAAGGTYAGKLYLHTGPIAGMNFTNNRTAAVVTGVGASGDGSTVTFTGSFLVPDFPVGVAFTVQNCGSFNNGGAKYTVLSSNASTITAASGIATTASGCQLTSSTIYPPGFQVAATCTNSTPALQCQMSLPWVVDARTVCTAVPCTLPAGIYAAAWGTTCSSATATNCAQLMGDADLGEIYPFTASANSYDSAGLPATLSMTLSNTSAVWNTTQGTTAPIKPAKLLIYYGY